MYYPHEPDHVIAEKHGGPTSFENLAWACFHCNRFKGSDLASVDPLSGKTVFLFNPREQRWTHYFTRSRTRGSDFPPFFSAHRKSQPSSPVAFVCVFGNRKG